MAKPRIRSAIYLPIWIAFASLVAYGQVASNSSVQKFDLGKLGYVYPKIRYKQHMEKADISGLYNNQIPRIVFLDENHLAAYYSTDAKTESVETIIPNEPPLPRTLSVFFIRTGEMQLERREWPARNRRWMQDSYDTEQTVLPVHSGNFLVHSGGQLFLYSPNFNLLERRELKVDPKDDSDMWALIVGLGGDSIYLHHSLTNSPSTDQWLNADTLQPERTITNQQFVTVDATDNSVLISRRACLLLARPGKSVEELLCAGRAQMSGTFLSGPSVLAEDRHQLHLLSLDGKTLWSKSSTDKNKYVSLQVFRRCLSGERFALLLTGAEGESWEGMQLKPTPTVAVYSRDGRLLLAVKDGPKFLDDFALSPTGSKLAILDHETLYLYDIQ